MKFERVVIGIDFSERSIAAAQWVARSFVPKAELMLVHVLECPPPPHFLRRRSPSRARGTTSAPSALEMRRLLLCFAALVGACSSSSSDPKAAESPDTGTVDTPKDGGAPDAPAPPPCSGKPGTFHDQALVRHRALRSLETGAREPAEAAL